MFSKRNSTPPPQRSCMHKRDTKFLHIIDGGLESSLRSIAKGTSGFKVTHRNWYTRILYTSSSQREDSNSSPQRHGKTVSSFQNDYSALKSIYGILWFASDEKKKLYLGSISAQTGRNQSIGIKSLTEEMTSSSVQNCLMYPK